MTLTTTAASHAHATTCQETRRAIALPAAPAASSRAMAALTECLSAWDTALHEHDRHLRHSWATVAELHRCIAERDEATASVLRGSR